MVLAPALAEPAAGRDLVTAAVGTARQVVPAAGWSYRSGGVEVVALGPPYPMRGTRSDPNNNSLVLRATVAGVRIVLPGDAETEEQRALLDRTPPQELRAEVLKVAHHGSAYQDPAFLDAVRPMVALVSVGVDNDYGHPSPVILDRLVRSGARVLRTDTDGDVAVVVRSGRLAVVGRGLSPGRR